MSTQYSNNLWINPTNQANRIGQAEVTLTCQSASAMTQRLVITGHPRPADPVANAIGTINVTCLASQ